MKKTYVLLLAAAIGASSALAAPIRKGEKLPRRIINVTPQTLPATDITSTGFTANWEAVAGADGYCVFCYAPIHITEPGEYAVLDEGFNLVNIGSTVEPVWHEGFSCTLDEDYDFTFSPDWTVIGCAFAKGMVSGNIYTPVIDLTNNNGNYKLVLDIVGQQGTKIRVTSTGSTTEEKEAVLDQPGGGRLEFEFSNGCHETWLYIVDMGIEGDDEGQYANVISFFDNISIVQDLQAGDTVLRLVDINDYVQATESSCRFDNMKFLYDATELCYDLYAAYIFYDDPDDPWNYEMDYSNFSDLCTLHLEGNSIADIENDPNLPVQVYDLQGRHVADSTSGLDAGIYVVRQGDKSKKIIVK